MFVSERVRNSFLGNWVPAEQLRMMKVHKMKLETGRVEKRFGISISVCIRSLDRLWLAEEAMTENVSFFGARILLKNMWERNERIVVESPGIADPYQATVVYCQALKGGGTAIGVCLERQRSDWMSGDGRIR
jgi:hypothetical protein